jgi:hypothetical protein
MCSYTAKRLKDGYARPRGNTVNRILKRVLDYGAVDQGLIGCDGSNDGEAAMWLAPRDQKDELALRGRNIEISKRIRLASLARASSPLSGLAAGRRSRRSA